MNLFLIISQEMNLLTNSRENEIIRSLSYRFLLILLLKSIEEWPKVLPVHFRWLANLNSKIKKKKKKGWHYQRKTVSYYEVINMFASTWKLFLSLFFLMNLFQIKHARGKAWNRKGRRGKLANGMHIDKIAMAVRMHVKNTHTRNATSPNQ